MGIITFSMHFEILISSGVCFRFVFHLEIFAYANAWLSGLSLLYSLGVISFLWDAS